MAMTYYLVIPIGNKCVAEGRRWVGNVVTCGKKKRSGKADVKQ